MADTSQSRAVANYRRRQIEKGLVRVEVMARRDDRELIHSVARHLADNDAAGLELRAVLTAVAPSKPKGNLFARLRASPLVGEELDIRREVETGRDIQF